MGRHAEQAFADGDYRWAAELLKHALAAEPEDKKLRALQADVFEQLGYRSESGPWRNFYLLTAAELRGRSQAVGTFQAANAEMAFGMDLSLLLDFVAIRLHGPRAAGRRLEFVVEASNTDDGPRRVIVERGVLRHEPAGSGAHSSALVGSHDVLARLSLGGLSLSEALDDGGLRIDGDRAPIEELFALLDDFTGDFSMVAPHTAP